MSCLHLRNLTVEFSTPTGTLRAVDGVSLDHSGGDCLALIGETGSGKSVIAHAILGLLPGNASVRGVIKFEDQNLLDLSERERARLRGDKIGIVLQNPSLALNPIQKIGRQIGEPISVHRGVPLRSTRKQVKSRLERLGFHDVETHLDAYPFQFSGGMNQRVLIAASMILEPRVLIADEPTKGLDAGLRNRVREKMFTIKQLNGSSLLLITHDLELAREIADTMVVLYGGQVMEIAPTAELFSVPRHPYSRALLQSLPENGFHPISGPRLSLTDLPSGCRFHARCPHRPPSAPTAVPSSPPATPARLNPPSPHELSGGEKRLVAVPSIISMRPKVILMDEPNSSLDSRNRRRLIRLINNLDLASIVASHDLEFLLETCSRVALMDEGRICRVGPIRDILSNQELREEHGLEKPHSLVPHTGGSQRHAPREPRQKTVRFGAIPPDGY